MPPKYERDHETVHLKVPGRVVIKGRLVTKGEVYVVVDPVPQSESEADIVELLTGNAIDAGFAAIVPGAIERSP